MENVGNEKSRTFENDAQGTLSEQDFQIQSKWHNETTIMAQCIQVWIWIIMI